MANQTERYAGGEFAGNPFSHETVPVASLPVSHQGIAPGTTTPGNTMIPNALTACRGFVLRKIGGRYDACRQLLSSGGVSVARPSLLGTLGVFLLMLMPVLLLLAAAVAVLHGGTDSLVRIAEAVPVVAAGANLREMRDKRSKAIADARSILDKAETEKRALSTEEETRYNAFFNESEGLKKSIERSEQLAEAERSLAAGNPSPVAPATPAPSARTSPRGTEEYRSAFARFITFGERGLRPEEQRALSVGNDTEGGFTVASEQFVADLIKAVDNATWIRQLARKFAVPTAASLGAPSLDADPEDASWTSEIASVDEDSEMTFGKRKLVPHPLAKLIKVSKDFLRMNLVGGEGLVRDRIAYKNGIAQEKGFMTGTGVNQALGVFVASDNGISTGRDYSTGNLTGSPTFDGLIGAKYTLKQAYWDKANWAFHRDVLALIAKLKDGNGQYIWRESVRVGEPDRLLNVPVRASEYAPNTMTTGLYAGIIGDFSNYWIADAYDVAVQRLDELYARTNQVGFISRAAVDGMPVLEEAFVRVKLG
jgi:HK97 family phage major capsid protein